MMIAFCAGVNMKLAQIPYFGKDASSQVRMTRMGYQDDLYFWGGAWQSLHGMPAELQALQEAGHDLVVSKPGLPLQGRNTWRTISSRSPPRR